MTARRRIALVLGNVLAWAFFVVDLERHGVTPKQWGWDLAIMRVGTKLLLAHQPLYDFAEQARLHALAGHAELGRFPFAYPPIAAIALVPLAPLSNLAALAVVAAAAIAAFFAVARRTTGSAMNALYITAAFPGAATLVTGQLAWLAFFVFALTAELLRREHYAAAGLVASVLAFKPTLLILMPVALVVVGRVPAVLGLLAGLAVQIVVCLAVAPSALLAWPHGATEFSRYVAEHPTLFDSVTWRATFGSTTPAVIAMVACGVAAVVAMARSRADTLLCMSACVFGTLACAWHALPYELVLVALPFFWLGRRVDVRARDALAVLLVAASWSVQVVATERKPIVLALFQPAVVAVALWWLGQLKARRGEPRKTPHP